MYILNQHQQYDINNAFFIVTIMDLYILPKMARN